MFLFSVALFSGCLLLASSLTITNTPCAAGNEACISTATQEIMQNVIKGIPELEIEPFDPLFIEKIDGDLGGLVFKLTNTTATGLNNCVVSNAKLNLDESSLYFKLTCRHLEVTGDYNINGRLIVLPVEGMGKCKIHANKYIAGFSSKTNVVKGKDGKQHLHIKTFSLDIKAEDGIVYDFQNLFNGNQDLANAVLTFANENWKEVADFVQEPILTPIFKKFVKNANKYFKNVAVDDIVAV